MNLYIKTIDKPKEYEFRLCHIHTCNGNCSRNIDEVCVPHALHDLKWFSRLCDKWVPKIRI